MRPKPTYTGDPEDFEALARYEEDLRAWEAEAREQQREDLRSLLDRAEQRLVEEEQAQLTKAPLAAGTTAQPVVLVGAGVPDPSLGLNGQGYIDAETTDLYAKRNGTWVFITGLGGGGGGGQGPPGPQGPQGPPGMDGMNGAPGADGADGEDGNDWRTGSGTPSIVAGDEEGDLYLDEDSGDVYQVQSSAWVLVANIEGPTGPQGPTGPDGKDGEDWRVGTTVPSIQAGDDEGDFYLDSLKGDIYQVQSGAWVLLLNITGADGEGVPSGGTSDQYLAKIDGTDFNTEWRTFNQPKLGRWGAGASGSTTLSGATTMPLTAEFVNTSPSVYSIASNEITIAEAGTYLISAIASLILPGGAAATEESYQALVSIQADEGSGYGPVRPTILLAQYSDNPDYMQEQFPAYPVDIPAGTKLKILASQVSGTESLAFNHINCQIWLQKIEAAGPQP